MCDGKSVCVMGRSGSVGGMCVMVEKCVWVGDGEKCVCVAGSGWLLV